MLDRRSVRAAITVWELEEGKYGEARVVTDTVELSLPFPVRIVVADLGV